MKRIILLLATTFSAALTVAAQQSPESFLNEVCRMVVGTNRSCYSLHGVPVDSRYADELAGIPEYFEGYAPVSMLQELAAQGRRKHAGHHWNFGLLHDPKWLDVDSFAHALETNFHPVVHSDWTEEERQKQIDSQAFELLVRTASNDTIRLSYTLFPPVFDKSGHYAVLVGGSHCGMLCGHGFIILFRKEEGHWMLVTRIRTWVS